MKATKTTITKTSVTKDGHKIVESWTEIEEDQLSSWARIEKTKTGKVRLGLPTSLIEVIEKYPQRQLIAESAFLGGDNTPQIGPYHELETEIGTHSVLNIKSRAIILRTKLEEWHYAILVTFSDSMPETLTDRTFVEARWKVEEDTDRCLGDLLHMGEIFVGHTLYKLRSDAAEGGAP